MPLIFEDHPELTYGNFTDRCNYQAFLYGEAIDIGGGTVTKKEIDIINEHPELDRISVAGLHQDTFDYFVNTYGHRFKAIYFFKNKTVADLSALSELENIEVIGYFLNQRADKLWDMSGNKKLKMLEISDFSRLKDFSGIETAPALEALEFGNKIWARTVLDIVPDMSGSPLNYVSYNADIGFDNTYRFLSASGLKTLSFPTNAYPVEFVVWICSNYPALEGFCLKPYVIFDDGSGFITGKRKPHFDDINDEKDKKKVDNAVKRFEEIKAKLKGLSFSEIVKIINKTA